MHTKLMWVCALTETKVVVGGVFRVSIFDLWKFYLQDMCTQIAVTVPGGAFSGIKKKHCLTCLVFGLKMLHHL